MKINLITYISTTIPFVVIFIAYSLSVLAYTYSVWYEATYCGTVQGNNCGNIPILPCYPIYENSNCSGQYIPEQNWCVLPNATCCKDFFDHAVLDPDYNCTMYTLTLQGFSNPNLYIFCSMWWMGFCLIMLHYPFVFNSEIEKRTILLWDVLWKLFMNVILVILSIVSILISPSFPVNIMQGDMLFLFMAIAILIGSFIYRPNALKEEKESNSDVELQPA